MSKSDTNINAEIDEIEIIDLPLAGEPLAKNQPGKKQNNITQYRNGWHFKRWRRKGMTLMIFTGCMALCLLIWPDLTALFPKVFTYSINTSTTIPIQSSINQDENPLLTGIFVFGNTAYISTFAYSQPFNESRGRLDAIHISDGKSFWHASNSVIATPLEANGILFIPSTDGIYALRASDHVILWHTHTPANIYRIDNGLIYTYPLQSSGQTTLVMPGTPTPSPPANILRALRVRDGSVAWQRVGDTATFYVGASSGIVYLSTQETDEETNLQQGRLDAIRISDGAVLWSKENAKLVQEVDTVGNSLVCLTVSLQQTSSPSAGFTQNPSNIDVLNRINGQETWQQDDIQPIEPFEESISVKQGVLYTTLQTVTTFKLLALHLTDGSVLWQKSFAINQDVEQAGDVFYLISSPLNTNSKQNVITVTAVNTRDGSTLWQRKIPGYRASVAGNIVYTVSDSSLDAWQAADGSPLWQRNIQIQTNIAGYLDGTTINGIFYLVSNSGWIIHALSLSDGSSLWDYEEKL